MTQFGGELFAEILRLEDLPDFHFGLFERGALEPVDRLIPRLHLPYPEARDQLFGLAERPVGDSLLPPGKPYAGALRARMQTLAGEHDARSEERRVGKECR